ncbi:LemA family protein [Chitinispirillales bacterium ANBcel5]|uniref:LemA family protein n=1 Tax=Cellulosispirillum alkaliphilum TaxID=3039283 RepID=UPI002A595077|nr:LemA family protein [Chitinispirillales bacterium ANBcel5]
MAWVALVLILALLIIGVVYIITIYNGLVALKNNISKTWSNIDVLLKQRYDELPKLIKVCEGYMIHERSTLENVTKARSMLQSASSPQQQTEASNMLTSALRSLFALTENYPDLKSDINFRQLQARITELEEMIADRREFYNETVNTYNIRIQQFPDIFIANQIGYRRAQLWKINPEHRKDVKVEFSFRSP